MQPPTCSPCRIRPILTFDPRIRAQPNGEARKDALRVGFDRAIKLKFHGSRVRSDAGLFPYRDRDDAARLSESVAADLFDLRTGNNIRHSVTALLR